MEAIGPTIKAVLKLNPVLGLSSRAHTKKSSQRPAGGENLLHTPFFHRVSHLFCRIGAPLIRHYSIWRAKPMNDVVFEKAGDSCCCGVRNCLELDVLAEDVDRDDDVLVFFFS